MIIKIMVMILIRITIILDLIIIKTITIIIIIMTIIIKIIIIIKNTAYSFVKVCQNRKPSYHNVHYFFVFFHQNDDDKINKLT